MKLHISKDILAIQLLVQSPPPRRIYTFISMNIRKHGSDVRSTYSKTPNSDVSFFFLARYMDKLFPKVFLFSKLRRRTILRSGFTSRRLAAESKNYLKILKQNFTFHNNQHQFSFSQLGNGFFENGIPIFHSHSFSFINFLF